MKICGFLQVLPLNFFQLHHFQTKAVAFKLQPYDDNGRMNIEQNTGAVFNDLSSIQLKPFFALVCDKIIDYIMFKYQGSKTMSSDSQQMDYTPDHSPRSGGQGTRRRVVKVQEKDQINSIEGKWTKEENVKYVLFMDYHTTIFSSKEKRKSLRIFKSLAAFLGTRTARQCRSHFQKIMNKFKKLSKVKQHYQQLIGPAEYQNQLEELTQVLKASVVKVEEQKHYVSESIQTDPIPIRLLDLPNEEIIRLMNLLNQYYRSQYIDWSVPHPSPSQNTLESHFSFKEE